MREINKKISENGTKKHYCVIGDFLKDIEIMFSNCYNFNNESDSSFYSNLALRLYNKIIVEVKKKYSQTKKEKSKIVSSYISVSVSSKYKSVSSVDEITEHKSKKVKRRPIFKLQKKQQELNKKKQKLDKKQQELEELKSKVEKDIIEIEKNERSRKIFRKKKSELRDLKSLTEIYNAANNAVKIQLPDHLSDLWKKNALSDNFSDGL